jgi:hypothetical protein
VEPARDGSRRRVRRKQPILVNDHALLPAAFSHFVRLSQTDI